MRCVCDDVGPELMKCPRCGMSMAPSGRSVGTYACGGYYEAHVEAIAWLEDLVTAAEHHKNNKGGQQTNGGPPLLWNLNPPQLRELKRIIAHARTGTGVL